MKVYISQIDALLTSFAIYMPQSTDLLYGPPMPRTPLVSSMR